MTIGSYISFLVITITVTYSPGPMTIFLMNNGIQHGLKKTLPAPFGASSAYFFSVVVYVFGVTHFLKKHMGVYCFNSVSWCSLYALSGLW